MLFWRLIKDNSWSGNGRGKSLWLPIYRGCPPQSVAPWVVQDALPTCKTDGGYNTTKSNCQSTFVLIGMQVASSRHTPYAVTSVPSTH